MAIINIEYASEVLGMNRNVKLIYPEASKAKKYQATDIPVLYLLHGMSGNENSWIIRSGIDRLIRETNLAIVMPSTDLAWYTNTTYGMAYFDATAIELPKVIHNFFPNLSAKREKNFVAGLSMGGYGAFKLALATNNFSYAASLSGSLVCPPAGRPEGSENYWDGVFGKLEDFKGSENDLLTLAQKFQGEKPKLWAWCGKQDHLIAGNDYMAQELPQLGFNLTYSTSNGSHNWYYWTKKIDEVLHWLPIDYQEEERLI